MSDDWLVVEKKIGQARQIYAAARALTELDCERVSSLVALAAELEGDARNLAMLSACETHLKIIHE